MPTTNSPPTKRDTVKYKTDRSVKRIYVATWAAFADFIGTFLDFRNYVFRGHASDKWLLEPSLDRELKQLGKLENNRVRGVHLERFKYAARGRRGANPPHLAGENDWWALGQHHGLVTPLLDWAASPYVAAYFAFAPKAVEPTSRRVVFALSRSGIEKANRKLREIDGDSARTLEFLRPLTDENARLVSQGGLFTRGPDGVHVENWVQTNMADFETVTLYRIEIDDAEREMFLRNLNRMNINHLTLFPDLYGAAKYTNFDLCVEKY